MRRKEERWRGEDLHTCCLSVAFVILCLFICDFVFLFCFVSLGAAILNSVEKVTFCLAAPPINAKNAKISMV